MLIDSRSASVNTDEFYHQSEQSLNVSAGDLSTHAPEGYQDRRASSASTYMIQYHQQQQQQQQLQQQQQFHHNVSQSIVRSIRMTFFDI